MYCTCQKCDKKCMKCKEIIKQFKENRNHKDRQKLRQMLTEMYFEDVNIEERYLDDNLELVPMKKPKINDKLYEYIYYNYENEDENSFHHYVTTKKKHNLDLPFHIREIYHSKKDIDTNIKAFKTTHVRDEQKGFGVYFKSV